MSTNMPTPSLSLPPLVQRHFRGSPHPKLFRTLQITLLHSQPIILLLALLFSDQPWYHRQYSDVRYEKWDRSGAAGVFHSSPNTPYVHSRVKDGSSPSNGLPMGPRPRASMRLCRQIRTFSRRMTAMQWTRTRIRMRRPAAHSFRKKNLSSTRSVI